MAFPLQIVLWLLVNVVSGLDAYSFPNNKPSLNIFRDNTAILQA